MSAKCEKSVSLSYQSQCVLLSLGSEKLFEVPGRIRVRTEAAQAKRSRESARLGGRAGLGGAGRRGRGDSMRLGENSSFRLSEYRRQSSWRCYRKHKQRKSYIDKILPKANLGHITSGIDRTAHSGEAGGVGGARQARWGEMTWVTCGAPRTAASRCAQQKAHHFACRGTEENHSGCLFGGRNRGNLI